MARHQICTWSSSGSGESLEQADSSPTVNQITVRIHILKPGKATKETLQISPYCEAQTTS